MVQGSVPDSGVRELLELLDEAFAGRGIEESRESQALMTNLATVDARSWRARPPGVARTIESMVLHVGGCKLMYADHAFRHGTLTWEDHEVQPWAEGEAPMNEALAWLQRTHRALTGPIEALGDVDLGVRRMTNWGELRPTRWIIAAMIGHDFYHAGEINHLRSIVGSDDRWRWRQLLESGEGGD
jgi:uncharacterized damage-inducible protein DinB